MRERSQGGMQAGAQGGVQASAQTGLHTCLCLPGVSAARLCRWPSLNVRNSSTSLADQLRTFPHREH